MPITSDSPIKLMDFRKLFAAEQASISIPKDSLAAKVYERESTPTDQILRDLLCTLRLERNRKELREHNDEALEELFTIVDDIYERVNYEG